MVVMVVKDNRHNNKVCVCEYNSQSDFYLVWMWIGTRESSTACATTRTTTRTTTCTKKRRSHIPFAAMWLAEFHFATPKERQPNQQGRQKSTFQQEPGQIRRVVRFIPSSMCGSCSGSSGRVFKREETRRLR
jgi:hypothetical protein